MPVYFKSIVMSSYGLEQNKPNINIATIATTDKTVKAKIIIMPIVPTSDKNIKAKVF